MEKKNIIIHVHVSLMVPEHFCNIPQKNFPAVWFISIFFFLCPFIWSLRKNQFSVLTMSVDKHIKLLRLRDQKCVVGNQDLNQFARQKKMWCNSLLRLGSPFFLLSLCQLLPIWPAGSKWTSPYLSALYRALIVDPVECMFLPITSDTWGE